MTSTHWDMVYGRPPLSRDAVLFGVALALHLPLFLMQFKGVVRSELNRNSLVNIEMRDVVIDQILQRGMLVPPDLPPAVVKPVDLSFLIKPHSVLPVLPRPVAEIRGGVSLVNPTVISPKLTPSPTAIPGEEIPVVKGDRGMFAIAPGTVESIDPGLTLAGRTSKMVNIPTAALPQAEAGIKSPTPLTSRTLLVPPPTDGPVMPKSAIKVDTHAGTAIEIGKKPMEGPEDDLPVIRPQARALTPEQRHKELFPIHGALKDRAVDRQEIPDYPEWARKLGIESSVQFRFSVTADGRVKDNIEIVKGSGYTELDELARKALLRWLFAKLPPEKGNLVEDGVIEFRFSIK